MIDPQAEIGRVALRVDDRDLVADFYRRVLGLAPVAAAEPSDPGASLVLGEPENSRPLIELIPAPGAPPRPPGTTGLFHLAVLVPSRRDLARSLVRLAGAGQRLSGASDHLVSEALYLNDPEGNGIEIYRDRPREEWSWRQGELAMATLPLDLQDLVEELGEETEPGATVAAGTKIGHVHLNVSDLQSSEEFYVDQLGFSATTRNYPGALFVATGGYHHHIGLNTWNGEGAPPPPPGSRGLDHFEILLPPGQQPADLTDPSGNAVRVRPTP